MKAKLDISMAKFKIKRAATKKLKGSFNIKLNKN